MMKKRVLLYLLAVIIPIGTISAQRSYNHWSIQAKGGVNTIRGLYKTAWDRDYNLEMGGAVEYTLTPIVGLGLEYLYQNNDHPSYHFTSNLNQVTFFTSFNLSNLSNQFRKGGCKKFNTYLTVGGGIGFGDWKETTTSTTGYLDNNLAASVGVNLEYNIIPALAIGIEPQFRWNSNGKYNATNYQLVKDFYTINLNLRYKIGGSKMHIRNQGFIDYALDQLGDAPLKTQQTTASTNPESAVDNKMQELLVEQAKKEAATKDSLRADSIAKATVLNKMLQTEKPVESTTKQTSTVENNTNYQVQEQPVINSTRTEQPKAPIIEPIVEPTIEAPVNTPVYNKPVSMRTETYTNTALKRYSVVVGSFSNKANAANLSNKLKGEGYESFIVQNEQGMYRVITYTNNSIDNVVAQAKKTRARFADAWILVLK